MKKSGWLSRCARLPTPWLLSFASSPAFKRYYGGTKTAARFNPPLGFWPCGGYTRMAMHGSISAAGIASRRVAGCCCPVASWFRVCVLGGRRLCQLHFENKWLAISAALRFPCSTVSRWKLCPVLRLRRPPRVSHAGDARAWSPCSQPRGRIRDKPGFRSSIAWLDFSRPTLHAALSDDDARRAFRCVC